mgnify:CR=1 FL=1
MKTGTLTVHGVCAVLLAVLIPAVAAGSTRVEGHAEDRVTEPLGRGVVAFRRDDGAYVGWRLLDSDPDGVAFSVYRRSEGGKWTKVNENPIRETTDYVDETVESDTDYEYRIRPTESSGASRPVPLRPSEEGAVHITIPLQGDYTFQKVGIGDLNGDGRYDYVIKQPNTNLDPFYKYWERAGASEGTYKVEAYLHDGTFLWRKDLGWSIERGIWYSPMLVYDFNGDGQAEVALKTGEGDPRVKDAGNVDKDNLPFKLQGDSPVYEGKVLSGPEYVSVLDGMSGETIARADWPSRDGFYKYSYACRNQLCAAYLDGNTPGLIVQRGTYGTMKMDAYELSEGDLRKLWRWDNREEGKPFYRPDQPYGQRGHGAHSMHAADVDADGRDEILLGTAVVDDTGEGLWALNMGHPDHHYVGDIMPWRDGLEVYYGIEKGSPRQNGMCVVDARTGEILWGVDERTWHVHSSGLCADIHPDYHGRECYGKDRNNPEGEKPRMFSAKGELISGRDRGFSVDAVWWDADPQREILKDGRMQDYDGKKRSGRIKGSLAAMADVFGDWREEVITSVPGELRIYTSTIPSETRHICLMQDPLYRLDVAVAAMGYHQTPLTSYYMAGQ